MTYVLPGGAPNTFVPNMEASHNLVVGFSRNANEFALNRYIQIAPVDAGVGLYLDINSADMARVLGGSAEDFAWPDGNDAPSGRDNTHGFQFKKFGTERFAPTFVLGNKSVKQASWNIIASHAAMAAQQAMTARTRRVLNLITNAANFPAGHTGTATAIGGGKFDVSLTANQYIKKGLNAAAKRINLDTYAKVKAKDLRIVMNPTTAYAIAASDEVVAYVKNNIYGLASLKGEAPVWEDYGLPNRLYGFEVVVEDAVVEPTKKNATAAPAYLFPDAVIGMYSRPGALEAPYGGPSFSTVTLFELENMTTEVMDDPNNRRVMGRVVDDYDTQLTASAAGYLITACVG